MNLDEDCFLEHVAGPRFQDGVCRGKWGLLEDEAVTWPNAIIWVSAAARDGCPDRYYFHFTLTDYPNLGPTSYVWDPDKCAKLELAKWPKGAGNVAMAFRTNWNNAPALYAPWDRVALASHPDWVDKHRDLIWHQSHTIVDYLNPVHELLHSDQHRGC